MREACKFNVRIHNGNISMTSVTKDPGVSTLKYLTFQRQRHKLSAPTVYVKKYTAKHFSQIFGKTRNNTNKILSGQVKMIHKKNQKEKIL